MAMLRDANRGCDAVRPTQPVGTVTFVGTILSLPFSTKMSQIVAGPVSLREVGSTFAILCTQADLKLLQRAQEVPAHFPATKCRAVGGPDECLPGSVEPDDLLVNISNISRRKVGIGI